MDPSKTSRVRRVLRKRVNEILGAAVAISRQVSEVRFSRSMVPATRAALLGDASQDLQYLQDRLHSLLDVINRNGKEKEQEGETEVWDVEVLSVEIPPPVEESPVPEAPPPVEESPPPSRERITPPPSRPLSVRTLASFFQRKASDMAQTDLTNSEYACLCAEIDDTFSDPDEIGSFLEQMGVSRGPIGRVGEIPPQAARALLAYLTAKGANGEDMRAFRRVEIARSLGLSPDGRK